MTRGQLEGTVEPDGIRLGSTILALAGNSPAPAGAAVTVGLRPESLEAVGSDEGIPVLVNIVEELGAESFIHGHMANGVEADVPTVTNIIARVEPRAAPAKGELIHLGARDGSMLFFDAESGERIAGRP